MSNLEVLIDPIIEQNEVKIEEKMQIRKIIGVSLVKLKIKFRVVVRGNEMPDNIILKSLAIYPKNREGFNFTAGIELKIKNLKNNVENISESFEYLFPFHDIFWIDARVKEIPGFEIKTAQMVNETSEGRGWPSVGGVIDGPTIDKKAWRNYVIIIDRFAFEQKKMNARIKTLTLVLIIIAGFQFLITAFPKWAQVLGKLICDVFQ
ncbi:MAG: hypothetical protein MUO31_14555 [Thermodesulfovibrionales bacterium]|nr:hypothetical protein [Thermodesulfovibrionales bacterium]